MWVAFSKSWLSCEILILLVWGTKTNKADVPQEQDAKRNMAERPSTTVNGVEILQENR